MYQNCMNINLFIKQKFKLKKKLLLNENYKRNSASVKEFSSWIAIKEKLPLFYATQNLINFSFWRLLNTRCEQLEFAALFKGAFLFLHLTGGTVLCCKCIAPAKCCSLDFIKYRPFPAHKRQNIAKATGNLIN